MHINPLIFRAYDIRGIVGSQLNNDSIFEIGRAIGSLAIEQGQNTLVLGRDGRLSSPTLAQQLQEGILTTGCHVINIGLVPSPLVYFAATTLNIYSGVVVTGSHNPSNYNGVKLMLNGSALTPIEIKGLYERICHQNYCHGHGQIEKKDINPLYIKTVTEQIKLKKPLKIIIDCGNGAAGAIAPQLFSAMGCEVISLYDEIDGNFPNHHPDPSVPENLGDLINAVKAHQADIGLAFDGDADRLGVITNKGENIWPDRQLILYAIDVLSRHPGAKIIYDVKCSSHVHHMVKKYGGEPIMWKTGHSLLKAKLKETGALLAGEMSGHTFFKENWHGFDDAIYTAARLLDIISRDGRTSAEIFADIPNSVNTPELKLPIDEPLKFKLMEKLIAAANFPDAEIHHIDGLRVNFNNGWGLVRPSNTTPYLILRFEADDPDALNNIKATFKTFLLATDPTLKLPF